jgi:hypothetical protein
MYGLTGDQNAFGIGFEQVLLLFGVGLLFFVAYKFFK